MLFAVLIFVCVCDIDLKKIIGGNESLAGTDSSVPSSNTDLGLLQSDDTDTQVPSQNANDAELNNISALDSAAGSAADSGLDNLFSAVDEQQGVAQTQTVPNPINYPQQAAESQPVVPQPAAPQDAAPQVADSQAVVPQVEPIAQVPTEPQTPAVEPAPRK